MEFMMNEAENCSAKSPRSRNERGILLVLTKSLLGTSGVLLPVGVVIMLVAKKQGKQEKQAEFRKLENLDDDQPNHDHHKRNQDALAAAKERFLARKKAKDRSKPKTGRQKGNDIHLLRWSACPLPKI
ncbi:hypothetical protein NC652_011950 [Populus alba x Populus x berolinensis]|nr:hypothetical protein NC652_011950 [Populus alba x Populus x berolinensis]